jgi:uncharacterized membrane protein YfcA
MTFVQFALIFVAAIAAGGMNAIAGGGSFFTFPALLFVGVAPISANATNTIALWPGVLAGIGAYRDQLGKLRERLIAMGGISMLGGGLGAVLLLVTNETTFSLMIPFLMLLATVIFASSGVINNWLRNRKERTTMHSQWVVILIQFLIAVYGGFFGGGIGIMMLALLSVSGIEDMNEMNALKLILNALINGVAVVTFVIAGAINWLAAIVMIVGAIIGGYGGALLAQRVNQKWVRLFVIAVGTILTITFFDRYW